MLKLRLQRVGRTHEPSFRLVLTDSKNSTKSGRFKEILGSYDPRKKIDSLDGERIKYWLSQGVKASDTVHNLLVKHKIINAKKIDVSAVSKKTSAPADATGGEEGKVEESKDAEASETTKEESVSSPSDDGVAKESEGTDTPKTTEDEPITPPSDEGTEQAVEEPTTDNSQPTTEQEPPSQEQEKEASAEAPAKAEEAEIPAENQTVEEKS